MELISGFSPLRTYRENRLSVSHAAGGDAMAAPFSFIGNPPESCGPVTGPIIRFCPRHPSVSNASIRQRTGLL
jgi:hypothetical protein